MHASLTDCPNPINSYQVPDESIGWGDRHQPVAADAIHSNRYITSCQLPAATAAVYSS
ncbi:MAG TPA: hypothetical protein V6C57_20505 [Coleofasciculaceae cyanobacterium]